jgi:colanic acid/amylovoran biosynthesis glycosyltransferase
MLPMTDRRIGEPWPRVTMIVPAFPKLSETFIVSKFLGLLEKGFDITVACQRCDPFEWDRFDGLSRRPKLRRRVVTDWPTRPRWWALLLWPIAMVWCAAKHPLGLARYLAMGWSSFGSRVMKRAYLDATLIASRPNVVHFEFGTLGVDRTWLGAPLRCKVVVSFRGFDVNLAALDRPDYYQRLWVEADALHFLGGDLWRRALRRGCPPNKPHLLIPPAVDVNSFEPCRQEAGTESAGTAERPIRILSIGRLHWKKGYEDALMALRRIFYRGLCIEYIFVGDVDYI